MKKVPPTPMPTPWEPIKRFAIFAICADCDICIRFGGGEGEKGCVDVVLKFLLYHVQAFWACKKD